MKKQQWMSKQWYMMSIGQVGVFLSIPILFYTWYINDAAHFIASILTIVFFMIIAKCGYKISEKEGRKENGSEA